MTKRKRSSGPNAKRDADKEELMKEMGRNYERSKTSFTNTGRCSIIIGGMANAIVRRQRNRDSTKQESNRQSGLKRRNSPASTSHESGLRPYGEIEIEPSRTHDQNPIHITYAARPQ